MAASDIDRDTLRFRLATTQEMYASTPNSLIGQPPGLTIDATTGQVSWNTAAITQAGFPAPASGDVWTAQFMVEDLDAQGTVKSKSPIDIILKFVAAIGNPPTLTITPPGPLSVKAGSPVSFTVIGNDVDANARVALNATGIPSGASATTLNQLLTPPVTSTFTWTPTQSQGGSYVVSFTATDDTLQQALKSITVFVEDNQPPTITCPQPVTTQYGVAAPIAVTVADPNGDALSVVWTVDGTPIRTDSVPASQAQSVVTFTQQFGAVGTHPVSVTATDSKDASTTCSTTVNVVPADQTIAFRPLVDRTYGDAPFTLSATSSSGLPVAFAVASGPATVSGTTLAISGAGLVTIVASQDGDGSYRSAPTVAQTFEVHRATPVIALVGDASKKVIYGTSSIVLAGTVSSGTLYPPSGETVEITVNGAATTAAIGEGGAFTASVDTHALPVAPSPYVVAYSYAGDANFGSASDGSTSLTITPARLTITANDGTRTYGAPNPSFTARYSGFMNTDAPASLSGTLTFSTPATDASPVGSYPITPAGVSSPNYTIVFGPGTLAVTAAPLTVTADRETKVYGSSDPALTYHVNGLQLSDTAAAVLTGALAREAGEAVGSYPVHQGTLATATANYTLTFVDGALSVTRKPASVTPAAASKTYGAADAALTGTLSGFLAGDGIAAAYARTKGETVSTVPYTISAALAPAAALANYDVTYNTAPFTIIPAPMKVIADSASKVYGTPNPVFTAQYVGLVNGDTAAALGGALTFATNATTASPVGAYAVVPGGLTSPNYTIAFVPGTLMVTKAALTVTADDASKVFGAPNPPFAVSYAGFVLGEGPSALSGTLAFATTATDASPVGTYAITPSGLSSGNYAIAFVNGTLTVSYDTCLLYDPTKAVRSGATIPIKIQACSATGINASSPAVVVTADQLTLVSSNTSGAVMDAGNANPDSNFRFDQTLGPGYIFNLQTKGLSTGTYNLTIRITDDPQPHLLQFQVR